MENRPEGSQGDGCYVLCVLGDHSGPIQDQKQANYNSLNICTNYSKAGKIVTKFKDFEQKLNKALKDHQIVRFIFVGHGNKNDGELQFEDGTSLSALKLFDTLETSNNINENCLRLHLYSCYSYKFESSIDKLLKTQRDKALLLPDITIETCVTQSEMDEMNKKLLNRQLNIDEQTKTQVSFGTKIEGHKDLNKYAKNIKIKFHYALSN